MHSGGSQGAVRGALRGLSEGSQRALRRALRGLSAGPPEGSQEGPQMALSRALRGPSAGPSQSTMEAPEGQRECPKVVLGGVQDRARLHSAGGFIILKGPWVGAG